MRIALLAALKRTPTGKLRADLTLGGRSVLARQVQLARALGCERILCLCDAPGPEILRLQQQVERSGGEFHALRGFIQIAALVRADDVLLLLADGLAPDPAFARAIIAPEERLRPLIACLPAESGLAGPAPEDFERIDAGRRWAGLLAMRGAAVQQLADCPPDGDAHSLLLRLALQARTPCAMLPADRQNVQEWLMAGSDAAAEAQQQALIASWHKESDTLAPGPALARQAARVLAPLGMERMPAAAFGAAIVLLIGGAIMAAFCAPVAGLAMAACGAFASDLTQALAGLRQRLQMLDPVPSVPGRMAAAVDGLAAAALALAVNGLAPVEATALFAPIAIGTARLATAATGGREAAWWSDRALQLAAFALASGAGVLPFMLGLFSLGAIVRLLKPLRPV